MIAEVLSFCKGKFSAPGAPPPKREAAALAFVLPRLYNEKYSDAEEVPLSWQ
jgi:hypothetical protein